MKRLTHATIATASQSRNNLLSKNIEAPRDIKIVFVDIVIDAVVIVVLL
ncbi:MAG: hypothetical protein U1B30_05345 [Pseudomonadota bacterium]|nr:hypothetical protein [Pseudomonadota bacterium]